jgi:hypothetical protein
MLHWLKLLNVKHAHRINFSIQWLEIVSLVELGKLLWLILLVMHIVIVPKVILTLMVFVVNLAIFPIIGIKQHLHVRHVQLVWYIVFKLTIVPYVLQVLLLKEMENASLVHIIHIIQIKLIIVFKHSQIQQPPL